MKKLKQQLILQNEMTDVLEEPSIIPSNIQTQIKQTKTKTKTKTK